MEEVWDRTNVLNDTEIKTNCSLMCVYFEDRVRHFHKVGVLWSD